MDPVLTKGDDPPKIELKSVPDPKGEPTITPTIGGRAMVRIADMAEKVGTHILTLLSIVPPLLLEPMTRGNPLMKSVALPFPLFIPLFQFLLSFENYSAWLEKFDDEFGEDTSFLSYFFEKGCLPSGLLEHIVSIVIWTSNVATSLPYVKKYVGGAVGLKTFMVLDSLAYIAWLAFRCMISKHTNVFMSGALLLEAVLIVFTIEDQYNLTHVIIYGAVLLIVAYGITRLAAKIGESWAQKQPSTSEPIKPGEKVEPGEHEPGFIGRILGIDTGPKWLPVIAGLVALISVYCGFISYNPHFKLPIPRKRRIRIKY